MAPLAGFARVVIQAYLRANGGGTGMAKNLSGVSEVDMIVPAVRIAASRPGAKISTSELIKELMALFKPTGTDLNILKDRKDTHFSQKVRNLVSHKAGPTNLIGLGYAQHYKIPGKPRLGGIIVTPAGKAFLKSLGF